MDNQLEYYKFISKVSTIFLKKYDFDKAINSSLKLLAKRTNADRAYIFLFRENETLMDNTHEYCQKGVEPQIENLQNIDSQELLWWMGELRERRIINISDIDTLPPSAEIEKETLKAQGIKSLICFPFFRKEKLIGFIGLDNVKDTSVWDERSIHYLNLSTKLIAKAFEKQADKKKLSQMNATLLATLECSADAIVVIQKDGMILNHNENFTTMWDIKEEIRSKSNHITLPIAKQTLLSPTPDEFEKRIATSLLDSTKHDMFTAYRKDGSILEISSRPLYVENEHIGRVWKCTDITESKNYQQKLQLISKVFEKSNDAILITDSQTNIIDVNSAFERITGYSLKEVLGKNPSLLQSNWHKDDFYRDVWAQIVENGYWEGEIWDRRKNGEAYVNKTFIAKVEHEGNVTNYIGIAKDITQSKEYENKIKQLAFYDALTSLPNRTYFEQHLDSVIDESKRYERSFALLFLDLDNFKYVNDTFGHLIGDKLLQEVANRLKETVRKSDIVARLGGDEFTVIIKDIKSNFDLDGIAKKIIQEISEPIIIDGHELHVGTSIGICLYPNDTKFAVELIQKADIAMYNSKNSGKNRYSFFDEEMNKAILERYKIEQAMRESLHKDHFYMEYQPFVDCNNKSISAVEALLRWEHPSLGRVMPNEFIKIAEENGLIIKLGEWVFEKICLDMEEFKKHNIKKVSINISPKQLMDIHFANTINSYVTKYNIDTTMLEFEITESILMDRKDSVTRNLKRLGDMGITFALDDFGTGYSSLNYVKQFSIDTIKIDRSFIGSMHNSQKDMAIVNTILYLSKELNKNIVAEGVETTEQLDHFKQHESCQIQGYLFSKPLKLENLVEVLDKRA